MIACITGSSGLIGSHITKLLLKKNWQVVGIDNNSRSSFFGNEGSIAGNTVELQQEANFKHYDTDIRNKKEIESIFNQYDFRAVIHCAGQPSHDKATSMIEDDFSINAEATLHLLKITKDKSPEAVFIFTSTNKVYGDNPNKILLQELPQRFQPQDSNFIGFNEKLSIDQTTHSFFGSSKLSADIYCQEFGNYFGMKTAIFRLGCVTGVGHAAVKLHGFLAYLIQNVIEKKSYEIIGYKGKQVRDQIHADDVASAFWEVIQSPVKGEVFNLGGSTENSASILELIDQIEKKVSYKLTVSYQPNARIGDHIHYVSDISKFKKHYPKWRLDYSLDRIIDQLIAHNLENSKKNTI